MVDHDDDKYLPLSDGYLESDSLAASVDADAEIAAMQEAEDRDVAWLSDNGCEDDNVQGGIPAWFYKALYLDKP